MGLKTFIWGFCHNESEVINILTQTDVITPQCWLSHIKGRKTAINKNTPYKMTAFFSSTWIRKYRKTVEKYINCGECDHETYRRIYEKIIYRFIDHYSRHDMKLQSRDIHFYINQFNLLVRFFDGVFSKEQIDLVLLSNVPHEGVELIVAEIAKEKKIKTIILTQSPVPNKMFYLENIDDYGDFSFMTTQSDSNLLLEKKYFIEHFYMRKIKKYRFPFLYGILSSLSKPQQLFEQFTLNYQRYLRVKRFRKNLSQAIGGVDYNKKYVYFPLHLQPELTTSALGGIFNDQALALELLSKMIPKDWIIYVKENPKQKEFMRDETFFTRLKFIDNLQLVPLDENTFKLIEHSQFVATITGTAGWEAICGGKPALVFGKAWYQNFEGAFKWHKDLNVNDIANYQIDHEKLQSDYNSLISKCATGVIDRDYQCIVENYDDTKNARSISEFLTKLIKQI